MRPRRPRRPRSAPKPRDVTSGRARRSRAATGPARARLHRGDEREPRAARRRVVDEHAQRCVAVAQRVPARELAGELEQVVTDHVRLARVAARTTTSGNSSSRRATAHSASVRELREVDAVERASGSPRLAHDRRAARVAVLHVRAGVAVERRPPCRDRSRCPCRAAERGSRTRSRRCRPGARPCDHRRPAALGLTSRDLRAHFFFGDREHSRISTTLPSRVPVFFASADAARGRTARARTSSPSRSPSLRAA